MRVAVAGGFVLLAAWLIALALGVLGGYGSLPLLPEARSGGSGHEATRATQSHPKVTVVPQRLESKAGTSPTSSSGTTGSSPASDRVKSTTPKTSPQPSGVTTTGTTTKGQGKALGTTKTTGKPTDTPGNGTGGAPGQLR